MQSRFAARVSLAMLTAVGLLIAQKPPDHITFTAKPGNVTFDHAEHVKRAANNCNDCHDKLFPQSHSALNYKSAMHKTAEAAKKSCGGCHFHGGTAFESKGNCAKCHARA